MAVNARHYREELYRLRAHPTGGPAATAAPAPHGIVDKRDSFLTVYLSIIPFLSLEYYVETSRTPLLSGLAFPTSFLLFWAVYYSYYRPGFLEETLTEPKKWDMLAVPTILIGVTIWFVKVTVVELSHFLVVGLFAPTPAPRRAPVRPPPARPMSRPRVVPRGRRAQTTSSESTRFRPDPASARRSPDQQVTRVHSLLPREVSNALAVLGLREGAGWEEIHRRYRQLAKQFHPDLNPEVTGAGRRFMMYDAAYRKLSTVRTKYFVGK